MATGTVKWFNVAKGFGFIEQDSGGEDLFVEHKDVMTVDEEGFITLYDNERVTFEIAKQKQGMRAINVRVIDVDESECVAEGYVYLIKSDRYYKIGFTKDLAARVGSIKLQMPFKVEKVHVIEATSMRKVERYWHLKFDKKRLNGEWFRLNEKDVAEFKSHTKM